MDPPPQAHVRVGHDREYTTPVRAGQLAVTMRTHGDGRPGRAQREPAPASASSFARTGPPSVASAAA
ncbi:hypothetical protein SGLAM104S_03438 [Streptomyces glaucescens]